jgi:creatinine amidohydrolase/Fe(II)-dependent formamide hydrolase-like protein
LQPQTLIQLIVEVGRWTVASGFTRLIMLNANGPNAPALECARIQLRHELPRARFRVLSLFDLSPRIEAHYFADGSDTHANRGETELLMALLPTAVRPDKVVNEDDIAVDKIFSYDMPATTRSGVGGRAREASVAGGRRLADMLVQEFGAIVRAALIEPWPELSGPR